MEINTKFGLGDTVWAIERGRAVAFEITAITAQECRCRHDDGHLTRVHSVAYAGQRADTHPERQCFATKEELLNSL